jgi:hypothetical protein
MKIIYSVRKCERNPEFPNNRSKDIETVVKNIEVSEEMSSDAMRNMYYGNLRLFGDRVVGQINEDGTLTKTVVFYLSDE